MQIHFLSGRFFGVIVSRIAAAYRRFGEDDGPQLAAAVAYYAALSFFPLLIVLVAGISAVLTGTAAGQDAQHRLLTVVEQQSSPMLSEQIRRALATINNRAGTSGPIGFVCLLATAIAIFIQFEAAFDRIWSLPKRPRFSWQLWIRDSIFARLKAISILLGIGLFVILVILVSVSLAGLQAAISIPGHDLVPYQWIVALPTNMALNCGVFTVIYRLVPKVAVSWNAALQGGAVAAILWEGGRQLLTLYLVYGNYPSAYGIIGSFLAIMLWAYYAMLVIFYGAEYVRIVDDGACLAARLNPSGKRQDQQDQYDKA